MVHMSSKSTQFSVDNVIGIMAILLATVLSGSASIYFEKVIKQSNQSVLVTNIQLSMLSCLPLIFIPKHDYFKGYTLLTWICILLQALGGLIVAYVVKHADTILKGFATSISIILTFSVSCFIKDTQISISFLGGVGCVMYGIYS